MERLLRALNAVTDTPVTAVDPAVPLKQIEGWDSMRAVNFQMELEQEFRIDLSAEQITGNTTLNDVLGMLRAQRVEV